MYAGDLLEASKYSVVVESSALYNDVLAEILGIGQLDHLKQCVFDNGVSKSGRDVGNGCAFLLRLLNLGIHKYGTTGTQINWILGKKSFLCEILYTEV